ncbi:MAG TPA: glycosyltransferase family 1 protein [Anaerolineales bacterium]|nr:glycosyltransferase family 1 protein [Anaerolineales bacterium]
MRIGIDATALPPEPVGAGNYIIHLVRALASLDSDDEWVIFAQEHARNLIGVPACDRLEWRLIPDQSPARRLAWEQARFPSIIQESRLELLHSPHYTRPVRLSCASVVTLHDMTFFLYPQLHTRIKRLFFPRMIRYSARHADALITISDHTRRDAIRILHIPEDKITSIPLGIHPDFHPIQDQHALDICREKYRLPQTFILYVGLVEPRKNLPVLFEAYQQLLQRCQPPPLVIAGRMGWGVEQVMQQVKQLGLQDKLIFPGYVDASDLPQVYNLAQVFVYPSRYEGFGFPPLEAMACGTPTITSAVSAMLDHVGQAAVLVEPDNPQALSAAIFGLLTQPEKCKRLALAGPQQAARFTWAETARQTRALYQKVLSKR